MVGISIKQRERSRVRQHKSNSSSLCILLRLFFRFCCRLGGISHTRGSRYVRINEKLRNPSVVVLSRLRNPADFLRHSNVKRSCPKRLQTRRCFGRGWEAITASLSHLLSAAEAHTVLIPSVWLEQYSEITASVDSSRYHMVTVEVYPHSELPWMGCSSPERFLWVRFIQKSSPQASLGDLGIPI